MPPDVTPDQFNALMTSLWALASALLGWIALQIKMRMSAPAPPPAASEVVVAGDVHVIKSIDLLTQELGASQGLAVAMRKALEAHEVVVADGIRATEKNTKAICELVEQHEQLSERIAQLTLELARNSGRR